LLTTSELKGAKFLAKPVTAAYYYLRSWCQAAPYARITSHQLEVTEQVEQQNETKMAASLLEELAKLLSVFPCIPPSSYNTSNPSQNSVIPHLPP
jgi:hypothetical protein